MTELKVNHKTWNLHKEFNISRGSKSEAQTIEIAISKNKKIGIGECVPYSRYNETVSSVTKQIEDLRSKIETNEISKSNALIKRSIAISPLEESTIAVDTLLTALICSNVSSLPIKEVFPDLVAYF